MRTVFILLFACVAASLSFALRGGEEPKYAVLTHAEFAKVVEAKRATILDVNALESFNAGHVPGALHFASIEKELAAKLPKDKSAQIVAYCGGPACNAWKRAADAATALGYTNVAHYKGGISGWKAEGGRTEAAPVKSEKGSKEEKGEKGEKRAFAEISFADLKTAVEAGRLTVIDVNALESYTAGHVPGALHFASVEKDLAAKLPKDKGALIVAYCGGPACNAWKRGADAVAKLGYTNVKHFKGGISGWKAEGGRIEGVKP